MPSIKSLNLLSLEGRRTCEIPSDFFIRFPNLSTLQIESISLFGQATIFHADKENHLILIGDIAVSSLEKCNLNNIKSLSIKMVSFQYNSIELNHIKNIIFENVDLHLNSSDLKKTSASALAIWQSNIYRDGLSPVYIHDFFGNMEELMSKIMKNGAGLHNQ